MYMCADGSELPVWPTKQGRKSMIIVRMKGGLGNQMFQYAAGRSLALQNGLPLVLDKRFYNCEREHSYALENFRLADVPVDAACLPPLKNKHPLAHCLWQLDRRKPQLQRENGIGFDKTIASVSKPTWIEGYFQSERYFTQYAETVRADLTPVAPLDAQNAHWLAKIKADPYSVSLHVRRGDYVRNLKFAARHGSCTQDYYARAMSHVAQKMGAEPVIYAFSDDPTWVQENMKLPANTQIVGHNDASRNVEDLRLMSACRHHILANSSFSWWGAWLNPRKEKIVAAPAVWFADQTYDNPDIWAHGWTRIAG